jgi:hypothetical protein
MERILNALIERLVGMGVEMNSIPAFLRNLVNTLAMDPHISLKELNGRMESLGWGGHELDDFTLQLILASFDDTPEYRRKGTLEAWAPTTPLGAAGLNFEISPY